MITTALVPLVTQRAPVAHHRPVLGGRRLDPRDHLLGHRQNKTTTDFYAGGRSFSGFQNGLAIGGDYMSAASFLGIAGTIALYGYDGFLYSIGFLVAWLVALLLVAELLRNSGRYTMADVLRLPDASGAGPHGRRDLDDRGVDLLPAGPDGRRRQPGRRCCSASPRPGMLKNLVIVGVGVLMIVYVIFGGMKGTTWVQIVKAVLLMAGTLLITFLVLAEFELQPVRPARRGRREVGQGRGVPAARPALRQGSPATPQLEQARLHLARPRPGAGHRRPAAHPDPLLHRARPPRPPASRCSGRSA